MVERKHKKGSTATGWTTRLSQLGPAVEQPRKAPAEAADARSRRDAVEARDTARRPTREEPDEAAERKVSAVEMRATVPPPPQRPAFAAVAAFVRAAEDGGMTQADLNAWLHANVRRQSGTAFRVVQEPGAGSTSLTSPPRSVAIGAIVTLARERIIAAARGLLAQPARDSFLVGALVRGTVRRDSARGTYVATPRPTDALAEVVLSLFVADILAHRDDYEAHLRVCDVCGNLSMDGAVDDRHLCVEHALR